MPFVPDTAASDAPPRRGGFVPDAPPAPPAAPPAPVVPLSQLGAAAVPGTDPEWAAGRAPEQVADRQRRETAARNPIRDKVVGAVEGALDIVAKITGGGIGGMAGLLATPVTGGSAEKNMEAGAQRGVGVVRDIYRQARLTSGGEPETEFGRTLTEGADKVLQALPAVGTGPRGTLVNPMPEGAVSTAVRAARDTGRAAGDAALEAATPRLSPQRAALAEKAIDAGIPINLHQLTDSKAVRLAGEYAETVPGAGSKREQRRGAFTNAIARAIDPEATDTAITPDVFARMQDKAGGEIGDIMGRYEVPHDTFGDLSTLTRKDTPDVAKVVDAYVADLKAIADQNGGVVPGETLRKLRSEAQAQIRGTPNGDLRTSLGNFVNKLDQALAEVADEADMTPLADARRRYAISTVIEPLVAKSPDGVINPQSLMAAVTSTKAGKHRMARGKAGDMGDYARIGQEFLKDVASSNTAERNMVWKAVTDVTEAAKIGFTYPAALLYNVFGPKVAKKLIEAQKRRNTEAPKAPAPEPTLGRGFEDVPQGGAPARPGPLGDLTPDWETAPGATPGAAAPGVEPTGLVRSVDETTPLPQGIPLRPGAQIPIVEERPLGDLTPDWTTAPGAGGEAARAAEPGLVPALGEAAPNTGTRVDMRTRAGQEIPAVPGRPGMPDTLIAGGPAEVAATEPANAAMVTPGAIEARRQQGMAAVERAAAAERAQKVPAGEATEITPENVTPAPGLPDEKLPVGEATEITPENVKPAPEVKEHPEVAKIRQDIAKKREAEVKKQQAADELRAAAAAETDPEVKAAMIKRADAIAPAKTEKTNDAASKPVGTDAVRKEAGQEGVQEGGDAGTQAAKGGEEALSLDLPKIDAGLLDLQQRAAERAAPSSAPTPRGRRQVRRALERGIAEGTLDKDGASLALWALDRNENLARGLRVEVLQPEKGSVAKGSYNSATQIVKLFQGNDNPQTAMHEILHHSERMMPEAVQQGIHRAWQRALKAEMEGASPERRAAMEALNKVSSNDMTALDSVKRAFKDGVLKQEDYQYVNPTEYWAVNGARIMHERFTGRGSWRAQARQWLREMIEHVKGTVGVRSDSALLKALNEVLDPESNTGTQRSERMIKNRPESGGLPTSPGKPE